MDKSREAFIQSYIESDYNLYLIFDWATRKIMETGQSIETLPELSQDNIIQLIISLKPTSIRVVTQYLYIIGQYAKFVGDDGAYKTVSDIKRRELWEQCRTDNPIKKFISHEEFEDLLFNIEMYEEYNPLYYSTLLLSIYEGIYNDDMSVIKNLRRKDIKDNIVTLRDDNGNVFNMEISPQLAERLVELSTIDTWSRKNRNGEYEIRIFGLHHDSCFKIEHRGEGKNYRFSYFSRIRKIAQDYMDYPLRPLYLYVSGIIYRIEQELKANNMDLKFAFVDKPKDRAACKVIQDELDRIHYTKDRKYLRQTVDGFIEEFN